MKKFFLIWIVGIYLMAFSGLSLRIHFCGGEFNSFSFIGLTPNCGCDDDEADGCCTDSHFYFKENTEHHQTTVIENTSPLVYFIQEIYGFNSPIYIAKTNKYIVVSDSHPPGQTKCRKHILIGRFTC